MRHAAGYHAYARETPVLDAIGSIIAVASLVIGAYALLFLAFALQEGNQAVALQDGLFVAVIFAANGAFEVLRHWRRHHG